MAYNVVRQQSCFSIQKLCTSAASCQVGPIETPEQCHLAPLLLCDCCAPIVCLLCNWCELIAVAQALESAGIASEKEHIAQDHVVKPQHCGILIGSAMGGMATFAQGVEDLTLKVCTLDKA